jgi:hypothetical protein
MSNIDTTDGHGNPLFRCLVPTVLAILGCPSFEPSMLCSDQSPHYECCPQYLFRHDDHSDTYAAFSQSQAAKEEQGDLDWHIPDWNLQREYISPHSRAHLLTRADRRSCPKQVLLFHAPIR